MTDSKPTPGPWKATRVTVWGPSSASVATVRCGAHMWLDDSATVSKEEADANARLIAAAPDLMEALKEVTELYSRTVAGWVDTEKVPEIIAARAAIAKAEGRS